MNLYDMPISDGNYERAGSVLVSLRKSNDVSEMAILQCMIELSSGAAGSSFPNAAALCATTLSL